MSKKHLCKGLKGYKESGCICIPENGDTHGYFCEEGTDCKGLKILYCPFCGEKLEDE